jgi:hypothetical protein
VTTPMGHYLGQPVYRSQNVASASGLSVDLHRLPDVGMAQLHSRSWRRDYKKRLADKLNWIEHLLQAGLKARLDDDVVYSEPVALRIKVYYPDAHVPDVDNVTAGLKPLVDLLEPLRVVGLSGTRGYVGWVLNDRLISALTVERFTDATRAPLTQLRMETIR